MPSAKHDIRRDQIAVRDRQVSTLLLRPARARAFLILGHGAGTDMEHPFMEGLADALAAERVATLRYNFPYSERGGGPPDRAPVLVDTIAAVARGAVEMAEDLPLHLGGKSMGGRMASHAVAEDRIPDLVRGLVFFGFPLHRPREPKTERAEHLADVGLPMLFIQGTRDRMADGALVDEVLAGLEPRARLHRVDDADHGFAVPKRAGRTQEEILAELAETTLNFMTEVLG